MVPSMPATLTALPTDAAVRVVFCPPVMDAMASAELASAVDKLFAQFEREGSVTTYALEMQAADRFLVLAWCEPSQLLSGCRKDKLAKVLTLHGERHGCDLLVPPPILLATDAGPKPVTQGALRSQVSVGAAGLDSLAWNHLAQQLGEWNQGQPQPIAEIPWLATAVSRWARG